MESFGLPTAERKASRLFSGKRNYKVLTTTTTTDDDDFKIPLCAIF